KLRTLVDTGFEKEYYGFALRKGRDDDLMAKLNAGLAAIKADGTYDQIYAKWFNTAPAAAEAAPAPAEAAPASAASAQ
ncbi:MAG: transporter substrate-binding domain-containing protein, partial [Eikenella sp.]|nr:transporter substrate-binding domain-containing protein [Eikenella sp.]